MVAKLKVLVLSQSYEPMAITSARKGFLLVYNEKAEVIDYSNASINSPNATHQLPSIIRLRSRPKFNRLYMVELTRKNIFRRDHFKCQYCGASENLTVDHIVPKSKGGTSTWENLVTACHSCNNKKGDLSLDNSRMRLLSIPKKPHFFQFLSSKTSIRDEWKPYLFLS